MEVLKRQYLKDASHDPDIGHAHERDETPIEDIWVKEVDSDKPAIRLTSEGTSNSMPYWSR